MKNFKNVESAVKFIDTKADTGKEIIINGSLHFGVGSKVYAYSTDVKKAGIPANGTAFSSLDRSRTEDMLHYLLKTDGHLTAL